MPFSGLSGGLAPGYPHYHADVADLPITTTLLLNSLKDERDAAAWTEFDTRYRRVIEDFARSAGLGEDDATEVAQQTLVDFVSAYRMGRYSREKGRLHSWIFGIAQNKVADTFRSKARAGVGGTQTALFDLSDESRVSQIWGEHVERAIYRQSLAKLKAESEMDEKTILAFELVAVRGASVEAAARECGIKPAEVYVAKHRVTAKLRKLVEEVTKAWET